MSNELFLTLQRKWLDEARAINENTETTLRDTARALALVDCASDLNGTLSIILERELEEYVRKAKETGKC